MSLQQAITYLSKLKYFNFKYLSFADKNKVVFYNDKQFYDKQFYNDKQFYDKQFYNDKQFYDKQFHNDKQLSFTRNV
jgi:hypothetical protein